MPDESIFYSDAELKSAISSATDDLARIDFAREQVLSVIAALREEGGRRRLERVSADYETARRRAAMEGSAPPVPPKGLLSVVPNASAVRASLMPEVKASPSVVRPALGQAVPVVMESPDEGPVVRGVSDHAVLRYLERVLGVDMDAIRARIMTPLVESAIRSGVVRIRTSEGVVVSKRGMVTSFLPSENGPNRVKSRHIDRRRKGRSRPVPRPCSEDVDWSSSSD